MTKSEEFLNEIRQTAGLKRAVLSKVTVDARTVTFSLLTDTRYSAEDIAYARSVSARYVPAGYDAEVSVVKSIPSEEGVRREIARILGERFPSAAAFVSPEDIAVQLGEGTGTFSIGVMEAERAQFDRGGVLDVLTAELNRRFCGVWCGGFRRAEKDLSVQEEAPPLPEELIAPRMFPIEDYEAIDGAAPAHAVYISDLRQDMKDVTVCGTIGYIEERETKTGKPFFVISLEDATGQLRVTYFTRKATLEKVRALKRGDSVCLTGEEELFNGGYSFRVRKIDLGRAPKDFVPQAPPSRSVPAEYRTVFPEPEANFVQDDLFGRTPLPQEFTARSFVVVDLETTGLNHSPAGGLIDRIIELGAVKIEGGIITQRFHSFVACPVKLSEKIRSLTGIDDEMLVGAPEIGPVITDFYKFCDGCALVAHNAEFDLSFIRYYGEQEGFRFSHPYYDTLALSQETLRLPAYKLNNLVDYFGFTFQHHRAYDDALATAKVFIELVRMRGKL